jgi:hypothetical protein
LLLQCSPVSSKDKFRLEDRLALILSLSYETLLFNKSVINPLALDDIHQQLIDRQLPPGQFLSGYINEQFMRYIFNGRGEFIFSKHLIHTLINRWLEFDTENPLLNSYIITLHVTRRLAFLENFLANNENNEIFLKKI